ncbi:MAG: acetoacetate--CoA ligase [Gammaproteobacteria bacterium]|nr:acetoacetate--CoA ligase [Gammaproteobacteria bacterium]
MPDQPSWSPGVTRRQGANLTRFIGCLAARRGLHFEDYASLHRWSIEQPDAFWFELAHFVDICAEWAEGPVLVDGEKMPGARWFPGARLNFAENLLHFHDDHPALLAVNERGQRRTLSYRQLHTEVGRITAGLREAGVKPGDRVVGFMPNLPETVVAMLAATSLGAIWSSCSPDFGIAGVLDRFGQIAPKVLITADGYFYAGKTIDSLGAVSGVLAQLSSVTTVIIVPYVSVEPDLTRLHFLPTHLWSRFGTSGAKAAFTRLPFDHPLLVMYSSGTTGKPKCIVHGAGGTLLQHLKEHELHVDLRRQDRFFFFTTCGWMMWNWLVSGLAVGATLVLYDGSPLYPDEGVLWRMAEEEHVTIFGTSPKFLATLSKAGYRPRERVTLPALRTLISTGAPLAPEQFDFVYREIKSDLHLTSISGGTDIISCFCIGDPTGPVYRGELQCAGLGMDIDVVDDSGRSLPADEKGELVCRRSFPSMPVGFWDDEDGRCYRKAYFERFPGIWHHSDYAMRTCHGGFVILGRSDAVLNPGGVRIGTAEIYRQVETLPEVLESLCIGQDWQGDVRVVLFLRLRAGVILDEPLRQRIRDVIQTNTSPRHVPARIIAIPEIPRTINGKVVELAVHNIIHGRPVTNTHALANPDSLELFKDLPELRT